jgi:predicted metal-binding membrane protein
MIVAMMLPSALPAAAYAGAQSLRWRRRRAIMQFILGYTAVWLLAGALILVATTGMQGSPAALGAAVIVAAAWQLMPPKRRALLDCHRPAPLPPYGAAAPRAAVGFGVRHGWACVRSCWALMVVMSLVWGPQLEAMAVLTVLVVAEKFALRPRRASRRVSAVLGAAAMAGVVALV